MYDGEGTVRKNTNHPSGVIQITQSMHNPEIVERLRTALKRLQFDYSEYRHQPPNEDHAERFIFAINGGWRERYRFLASVGPQRSDRIIETMYTHMRTKKTKLVSVQDAGR